jgi:hypothetical protein
MDEKKEKAAASGKTENASESRESKSNGTQSDNESAATKEKAEDFDVDKALDELAGLAGIVFVLATPSKVVELMKEGPGGFSNFHILLSFG